MSSEIEINDNDDIEIVDTPPEPEIVGPHTEIAWDEQGQCWAVSSDEPTVEPMADEFDDKASAPHLDICRCQTCCPPDWRPLPPEPLEQEGLLDERELDALLVNEGIDRKSLSIEPVETPWGLSWSEADVRAEIADSAWRSRHCK